MFRVRTTPPTLLVTLSFRLSTSTQWTSNFPQYHTINSARKTSQMETPKPPDITRHPGGVSASQTSTPPELGRGNEERGRGGRGGGRARGGRGENGGTPNDNGARTPKPKLTHFLALPIGHHAQLRDRMTAFDNALLASNPPISGLDQSIVIPPRRMHLTLGVMSLDLDVPSNQTPGAPTEPGSSSNLQPNSTLPPTLESSKTLLSDLRPKILEILSGNPLTVPLNRIDIMRPDRGDPEKAHVMWAGPSNEGEDFKKLKDVTNFIHKEFIKTGLVIDDHRPLKLHCTLLNTVYRKPKPKGGFRVPFSYPAVIESQAFRSIEKVRVEGDDDPSVSQRPRGKSPICIDLGEWNVDEIQICEMGSWGVEGEYICVGKCSLT
ncbi:Activating signal cointegrator 1 complex subunit 1 [Abortiporus biennis]